MNPLNETELNLTIKLANNEGKTFHYFIFINNMDNFPIKEEKSEYEWNFSTNGFKCRVDDKNKLS